MDTSVLLNILDVDGSNQRRDEVIQDFEVRIKAGDLFVIPMTTMIETGNTIGSLSDGNRRRVKAQDYTVLLEKTFDGTAPFKLLEPPSLDIIKDTVSRLVEESVAGVGLGDILIEEEWRSNCKQFTTVSYGVWSIDGHLSHIQPCNQITF